MLKLSVLIVFCSLFLPNAMAIEPDDTRITEDEAKKQFIEGCITKESKNSNKYKVYERCIGKFTEACEYNYDGYSSLLEDISVGPPSRNCTEREAIWWAELFRQSSKDLRKNVVLYLKDERIINALDSYLSSLNEHAPHECKYETNRWGYRNGLGDNGTLVNIAGLDDSFRCNRDTSAEHAITVYLWNKQLKAWHNIKN